MIGWDESLIHRRRWQPEIPFGERQNAQLRMGKSQASQGKELPEIEWRLGKPRLPCMGGATILVPCGGSARGMQVKVRVRLMARWQRYQR